MREVDLRALVRDAVARHLGREPEAGARAVEPPDGTAPGHARPSHMSRALHPAQGLYLTLVNTTDDCVIEPSVRCTHCGFCKTHGY